MITLSWFTLLILFGMLMGFFLLLSFLMNMEIKRTPGFVYLVGLLIIITVGQFGRLFYEKPLIDSYPRVLIISEIVLLSFGPIFFLYLRSRFLSDSSWTKNRIHLLPGLLHLLLLSGLMIFARDSFFQDFLAGRWFHQTYAWLLFVWLFNSWYAIKIYRLIQQYKKQLDETVSFAAESIQFFTILSYIFFSDLTAGFCLLIFGWIRGIFITGILAYGLIWIFLTSIAYFLAFYAISKPKVFQVSLHQKTNKYPHSKLTEKQIALLKTRVDMLMATKKLHLNPKLSKADMLGELDINSSDLSRVLNEGFGMNYFEYVNLYRVKEFIQLVEQKQYPHLGLNGIAEMAGFNSRATFYKAFKEIIGQTPGEYFRKK